MRLLSLSFLAINSFLEASWPVALGLSTVVGPQGERVYLFNVFGFWLLCNAGSTLSSFVLANLVTGRHQFSPKEVVKTVGEVARSDWKGYILLALMDSGAILFAVFSVRHIDPVVFILLRLLRLPITAILRAILLRKFTTQQQAAAILGLTAIIFSSQYSEPSKAPSALGVLFALLSTLSSSLISIYAQYVFQKREDDSLCQVLIFKLAGSFVSGLIYISITLALAEVWIGELTGHAMWPLANRLLYSIVWSVSTKMSGAVARLVASTLTVTITALLHWAAGGESLTLEVCLVTVALGSLAFLYASGSRPTAPTPSSPSELEEIKSQPLSPRSRSPSSAEAWVHCSNSSAYLHPVYTPDSNSLQPEWDIWPHSTNLEMPHAALQDHQGRYQPGGCPV